MSKADPQDDACRWMRYALEDLAAAKAIIEQKWGVPRQACWLAQQAAEKALKSALILLQTDFPRTHDLDVLCTLLPEGWQQVARLADLAELSEWSVEARYPGDWSEVTNADAQRACATAENVVRTILSELRRDARVTTEHRDEFEAKWHEYFG